MDITQNLIEDIWENNSLKGYNIVESAESEVDGKYILAKVVGPAFFPKTTSKNRVYYPLEAWENAISNPQFNQKLDSRLVYGTIGHDSELTDNDIRDGKFSHIVTKVWIDDNGVGQAEYLVLNTPPGQVLNTLLRVKSKIRVSTKAAGFFEPARSDGTKVIIPETFRLERIDFVIEPGYMNALPELIESLNTKDMDNPIKEFNMDANTKVVEILESRITELQGEKSISESLAKELTASLNDIKTQHAIDRSVVESYKQLGTIAMINEAFGELEQYRAIGTVQEIHEAFDQGEETMDNLTSTVSQLKEELEDVPPPTTDDKDYADLGSPEEVKDALDQALQIADELQAYRDLGSVDELQEVIQNAGDMTEALENQEKESICAKFSVPMEAVNALSDKGMTLAEVSDLLSQIKGVDTTSTTTAATDDNGTVTETVDNSDMTKTDPDPSEVVDDTTTSSTDPEDKSKPKDEDEGIVSESLSSKLFRSVTRGKVSITESTSNKDKPAVTLNSRAARLMANRH